jgi:PAS domain S-box-containing protein
MGETIDETRAGRGHAGVRPSGSPSVPVLGTRGWSPLALALGIAAALLISDLANMAVFTFFFGAPAKYAEDLWDSVSVIVLVAPALYWLVFRPIARTTAERERAEESLRRSRDELEYRVAERTAQLTAINDELRRSEEKHRLLIETMREGFCIVDREGTITYANERLAEILGRPAEDVVRRSVFDFVSAASRGEMRSQLGRVAEQERRPYELVVERPDGGSRHVVVSPRSLHAEAGVAGSFAVVTDVTRLKLAEEELRRLSIRLLTSQETERARLAAELHEGVAQTFTAVKFMLENALEQAEAGAGASGLDALRAVVPRIRDAVEEIRSLGIALRPPTLDDLGLLPTISWLCRSFRDDNPEIRLEKWIDLEEEEAPEPLKIVLYRVLQEALENVSRHSEASVVTVQLGRREGGLELAIADDGRGFIVAAVEEGRAMSEGFGLELMRERTQLSGGVFTLESAPGRGTTIRAWWPAA